MLMECAHCGLPVGGGVWRDGRGYCCYGCYLASRIVGVSVDGESGAAWGVLRLAVGAMLSMTVMMTALLLYTGSVEGHLVSVFRWVMLVQAVPATVLLAWPFVLGGVEELRRGRLSLDALVAVGSLTAMGVSVVATVRGVGHVYFDTATMLLTLVTLGKLIEASAKTLAGQWLDALERLLPSRATRLRDDDQSESVPCCDLRTGDRLLVALGEPFPADGDLLAGRSVVEEAAFTGEWRPRDVGPGGSVIAGTIHGGSGAVTMRVRAVEGDLLLRRIVERVRQAQRQPGRVERLARRAAAWLTPCVFLLAVGAGAAWLAVGDPVRAGRAALAVLVVACPCAMGIAAPLATALAISRAAATGAIVRGGDVLESLGLLGHVFFDKTGTLTLGRPADTAHAHDQPRPDALAVVAELGRMGIAVSLLSGDTAGASADMARRLGIRDVHAPKRPDEKADLIATARSARRDVAVAMVGDGINDAPALAQADVGVALSDASDLARHAGDVLLLNARLATLPHLIRLARRTRRVIRQNLAWAIAYNTVALATAAAGLLHPLLAAVLMAISCLTVVGNSFRVKANDAQTWERGTAPRR